MRIMGLDVGDKRIGVALSDPEEILASPYCTITRDNDDSAVQSILDITVQYHVQCIVVGVPYSLNGSIGQQAASIMAFVEKITRKTEIPIELQDERLSTVAAENLLKEAGRRRGKLKERRDSAAAAFILQGYMDSRKVYD
jgi:putative Holliday junction resolvase